jgi:hypothetical protein
MAIRVQRKRVKGWKAPENTVNVTRPGKWGNPFKVGSYYKINPTGFMSPCAESSIGEAKRRGDHIYISNIQEAVDLFERYNKQLMFPPPFKELKGKNLMCFCPLDKPCHADILLKLANN